MNGLATLLLFLVIGTHYTYDLIAAYYPDPHSAARAIFYVLRGVEGSILYLIVWALVPLRPMHVRLSCSTVCAWGALEEAQTAICRASVGITNNPSTGQYHGLCDFVTGIPVYMLTLLAVVLVFVWQSTKDN